MVNEAINKVLDSKLAFCKFIAKNDASDAKGHQGGLYIPKNSVKILFDIPGKKGENLERYVDIIWPNDEIFKSHFIYYGKGSRNEYRITRIGKKLIKDHLFILTKSQAGDYYAFQLNPEDSVLFMNIIGITKDEAIGLIPTTHIQNQKESGNLEIDFEEEESLIIPEIKEKIKDGYYKIRPAGRHILTIGRDLIKDKYAAIVELVKNSYDADSPGCTVSLLPSNNKITVIIKDEGHGMDFETVTDKWMVPSIDDKGKRKHSPKGRKMQGKKGIGRYSASIIGDDLVLQTIDESGDLTTLYLIWDEFESAQYLNDVNVLIENFKTNKKSGTEIIIVGDEYHLNEWNDSQIQNLKFELKKLIPPIDQIANNDDKFELKLILGDFPRSNFSNTTEIIEPYPIFNLFDYRISGTVSDDGVANLKFENQRANTPPEDIILTFNKNLFDEEYCGELKIDLSVFDRDAQSIDNLIARGLKDPITNNYVGKREARNILNTYNGIGVFRNGFRVRPLGDAGFDWLNLDKLRVQNPSARIGSDQVIGFIHIDSEDNSGLIEKSARDGLKENRAYFTLMSRVTSILRELETRRFSYRRSLGLGKSKGKINKKIEQLFDFGDVLENINSELDKLQISNEHRNTIHQILIEKEKKNNQIADDLKQAIALYQGQATLGKIVNVILHEGRKPLAYFKNQIPMIKIWADRLENNYDQELLNKVSNRLATFGEQGDLFSGLFRKLDPLSARKRGPKFSFNLYELIENVILVFKNKIEEENISIIINCSVEQMILGWKEDFFIALTNLIENSIYWLINNNNPTKEIEISAYTEDQLLIIEYKDNGPGIKKEYIESEVIFEPEFSTKTDGMGLGLAIAGEAVERNNGTLKAIYSVEGAYFKFEFKTN